VDHTGGAGSIALLDSARGIGNAGRGRLRGECISRLSVSAPNLKMEGYGDGKSPGPCRRIVREKVLDSRPKSRVHHKHEGEW